MENEETARPRANDVEGCLYHAALLLASEHQGKHQQSTAPTSSEPVVPSTQTTLDCGQRSTTDIQATNGPSRKRKREDNALRDVLDNVDQENLLSSLPPMPILNAAVDCFFARINHWIPFLHPPRFKAMVAGLQLKPEVGIILHAIVSITMKYMGKEYPELSLPDMNRQIRFSRNAVKLMAMDSLTIEGIQALIIIAFDYVSIT